MYLHLGPTTVIRDCDVIGIFDLDITSQSYRTRQYLNRAEKAGEIINAAEEQLPKSFVLCQRKNEERQRVYLTQPNSATLQKRLKQGETGR